jgi:Holliday junction resolvase
MGKGARAERDLLNHLDELGYTALRIPASGSGTTRALPDLLVGRALEVGGFGTTAECVALEVKYRAKESQLRFYLKAQEGEGLREFAEGFGATPLLAVRWSTRIPAVTDPTWYYVRLEDLARTPGGQYRVVYDEVRDTGVTDLPIAPPAEKPSAGV